MRYFKMVLSSMPIEIRTNDVPAVSYYAAAETKLLAANNLYSQALFDIKSCYGTYSSLYEITLEEYNKGINQS